MPRKRSRPAAELAADSSQFLTDYVEGAIVRIKLNNFMNYNNLEMFPGPRMNMVLGPNGAGKSTILCAICLGLGGKPANVGRAGNVSEYIKRGRSKAKIEIELHRREGSNYIVTREIQANNQSHWTLDSKSSSQKGIDELMNRLNIQMKNLCQFIPQDKVADFVQMSKEKLLENTEKAANVEEMWENHNRLMEWNQRTHNLDANYARVVEDYERESQRMSSLNEEVAIYNERQDHLQNIDNLKKKKAWMVYERENDKYKEMIKEEKKQCEILARLSSTVDPLKKVLADKNSEIKTAESDLKDIVSILKKLKQDGDEKLKTLELHKDQIKDALSAFSAKQHEEDDKINRLNVLNKQLQGLHNDLNSITHNDEDIVNDLNIVSRELNQCSLLSNNIHDEREKISMSKHQVERELAGVQNELKQQKDVNQAKMQVLSQKDGDAYRITNWLNQNRTKFKARIYGPIMIEINMRNPAHAKYIEHTVSFNDMIAFVCEDSDDIELLTKTARNELRLRINVVMAPSKHPNEFKPPRDINSIKHLGFHSYLKDMIDAPAAVLSYLCAQYHFHTIPVGNESTKSKVDEVIKTTPFKRFFTDNHIYICFQSKYGNRAVGTRCSQLGPTNILTYNVNAAKIEELENKQRTLAVTMNEITQHLSDLKIKEISIVEKIESLRRRKKDLLTSKNRRRDIQFKIDQKETNIKSLEEMKIDLVEEKEKTNSLIYKINKKKLKLLGEHEQIMNRMLTLCIKRTGLICDQRLRNQDKYRIEEEIREKSRELIVMERTVDTIKRNVLKMKQYVNDLLNDAKHLCGMTGNNTPAALIERFSSLPNTIDEVERKIHELQAKADCMSNVNEGSLEDYKECERKLKILKQQKQKLEEELKAFGSNMETVKKNWLPPLLQLLAKINKRFGHYLATLGCAGEVGLCKGENENDYSKYGITIKVKFRDSDPLRELTQSYQSGGERSVATVLYLLALQEFVDLPFCCADEINQGMDSTNERRIFQLMTLTLGSETRFQYFLVTPKLLPDMEFHDNVKIHFVNGGSYNIQNKLDFDDLIRRRSQLDDD